MTSVNVKLDVVKCSDRGHPTFRNPPARYLFDRDEEIRVPAYVIATIHVTHPQRYDEYRHLVGSAARESAAVFTMVAVSA